MTNELWLLLLLALLWYCGAAVSLAPADPDCGVYGWPVPAPPAGAKLLQTHAIIRHGDRTPWSGSACWPHDASEWLCSLEAASLPMSRDSQYGSILPRIYRKVYKFGIEEMRGNCSVGQLTTVGYAQQVANGRALRKAYVESGFLSDHISPAEVYLRSDDYSRTEQSAEALMLGMYPPSPSSSGTEVVELNTADATFDYMLANAQLCPRYAQYVREFNQSSQWKEHVKTVTNQLLKQIAMATNITVDLGNFSHFVDCLQTHHCHGLSWPKGMTEDLYDACFAELSWQMYSLYKYPSVAEMAVVGIGFLLKEIWTQVENVVAGRASQKFLLYSGHDTTLIPILTALQVDKGVWPPYASLLLLEVYELSDGSFAVRLLYNNQTLTPPFCSATLCNFDTFSVYMTTITPSDAKKQCATSASKGTQ